MPPTTPITHPPNPRLNAFRQIFNPPFYYPVITNHKLEFGL